LRRACPAEYGFLPGRRSVALGAAPCQAYPTRERQDKGLPDTGNALAGFDRAALAIAEDRPADDYKAAIRLILSGLFEKAWRAGASEPRADLRSSAEGRF